METIMPCRKQYCPACGLQAMKCVKSISTGLDGHPLESGRVSSWRCESCGAAPSVTGESLHSGIRAVLAHGRTRMGKSSPKIAASSSPGSSVAGG